MQRRRTTASAVGVGALAVLVLAGCVAPADSGSKATLPSLQPPVFITQAPTTTTTIPLPTLPITVPGETTTLVPGFADGSTTTVAGGPQTYTVKANDTVLRIAQRFGVDAQALADYNHWSDGITHPIYPGTVIGIPAKTTTVTTTAVGGSGGVPSVTTTIAPGAGSTYTVKANDTVVGIARKYGITAQTLADYNNWSDGPAHSIFPGTVIKIPPK